MDVPSAPSSSLKANTSQFFVLATCSLKSSSSSSQLRLLTLKPLTALAATSSSRGTSAIQSQRPTTRPRMHFSSSHLYFIAHLPHRYQLALVNPQINANCTNIFGGQNLCLGEVGHDCDQTYVIASGDSCWAISQTFGIELAVLSANNPNVAADCSNIYPGEVSIVTVSVSPQAIVLTRSIGSLRCS